MGRFNGMEAGGCVISSDGIGLLFFNGVTNGGELSLLVRTMGGLPGRMQRGIRLGVYNGYQVGGSRFVERVKSYGSVAACFGEIPSRRVPRLFSGRRFLVLPCRSMTRDNPRVVTCTCGLPMVTDSVRKFMRHVIGRRGNCVFGSKSIRSLVSIVYGTMTLGGRECVRVGQGLSACMRRGFDLGTITSGCIRCVGSVD